MGFDPVLRAKSRLTNMRRDYGLVSAPNAAENMSDEGITEGHIIAAARLLGLPLTRRAGSMWILLKSPRCRPMVPDREDRLPRLVAPELERFRRERGIR